MAYYNSTLSQPNLYQQHKGPVYSSANTCSSIIQSLIGDRRHTNGFKTNGAYNENGVNMMNCSSVLDNVINGGLGGGLMGTVPSETVCSSDDINPAFNGGNSNSKIWDNKTITFDEDFKLEYMDLDEFLTENDLPIETVLQDQQKLEEEELKLAQQQQQQQQQINERLGVLQQQQQQTQQPVAPQLHQSLSSQPTSTGLSSPTSTSPGTKVTPSYQRPSTSPPPPPPTSTLASTTTATINDLDVVTSANNNNASGKLKYCSNSSSGISAPSSTFDEGKVSSSLFNGLFQSNGNSGLMGESVSSVGIQQQPQQTQQQQQQQQQPQQQQQMFQQQQQQQPAQMRPPSIEKDSLLMVDDLKPTPIIRKRKKQMVSEECKDDKYWERRRKNNMAAKRSRDARRAKENQIAIRASFLERENKALMQELSKARAENHFLKERLCKYEEVV